MNIQKIVENITGEPFSYIEYHEKSGLKVGDLVKIVCKCESHALGWDLPWVRGMDRYLGDTVKVISDDQENGFEVITKDGHKYWYPAFCLKTVKLSEVELSIDEIAAKFNLDPSQVKIKK